MVLQHRMSGFLIIKFKYMLKKVGRKKGFKHSKETREKMKNARTGTKPSEQTKEKLRQIAFLRVGDKSPGWKGDEVGIVGRHRRIIKLKGKASDHLCIDCNKQAFDWSNVDHLYSLNPDDYQPRCKSCHNIFDIRYNNRPKNQYDKRL